MMLRRNVLLLLATCSSVCAMAVESGLNSRQFNKYWRVESEAPDYRVTFSGDTCEITAPKGLTLWRKEKMHQDMTVEYDVYVTNDRLSDMNCFWMASDPKAKDIWAREKWRNGIFLRCYTLQMYYLGYGGNYNKTTRFRRYNGDEAGVDDASKRPAILKEYTDADHLLKPDHWYHVKVESKQNHTRFFIDGECIVDYFDPQPLTSGWFGFRTTLSRTRITNFKSYDTPSLAFNTTGVPLHWVNANKTTGQIPVSFGVPFAQGELKDASLLTIGDGIATDSWINARWPDGSVKWAGLAAVVPADAKNLTVKRKNSKEKPSNGLQVKDEAAQVIVNTGSLTAYIPKSGCYLIDSLCLNNKRIGEELSLIASTTGDKYQSDIKAVSIERQGKVRAVVKISGMHSKDNREWLPFTVRLYFYNGSDQIKMVHTFIYDGDMHKDMISSLGVRLQVPMREELYNRHIAFATDQGGVWAEPVQPLDGRRDIQIGDRRDHRNLQKEQMEGKRIPDKTEFDHINQMLLDNWAKWDGFRLSQLTDNSFSVRKRATAESPWIGTFTGVSAPGYAFVGDVSGGIGIGLKDFWQSYPSTIEVAKARSEKAELTMWIWSPEAEPMNLCHYDTIAHNLMASYEDVQEGMSTPYGIARTNVLWLTAKDSYQGKADISATANTLSADAHLLPTPEYLHEKRAFGIWSLPKDTTTADQKAIAVERRLAQYIDFYREIQSVIRGDMMWAALPGTIQNWPPQCGYGITSYVQDEVISGQWQKL